MNWKKEPLGKICKTTSGGTPSRKNQSYYQNGTIPWVKSGELENNIITTSEEFITEEGLLNSSAKIFPAGTLLIALYGATIGKLAFLGIDAATNQAVCGIFQNENVSLKYLYYYLLFQRPSLIKQGVGGAQPNISQTILKKLEISYPDSITEQQRIVARIEELFSELDKAVDTLKTTKEQLVVYRQAILQQAFIGNSNYHKRKSSIPKAEFKPVDAKELVQLASLPQEWKYVYLSDLGNLSRGKSSHRPRNDPKLFENGVYPFFQTGDVKGAQKDLYNCEKKYNDVGLAQSKLWPAGTLCITIAANIAETCFLGVDGCFPDSIVGFIPNDNLVLKEYIRFFIEASKLKLWAYAPATAQKNINLSTLENLIVPYCGIEEQQYIVQKIEEIDSVCNKLEQTIDIALAQADAMRQSILKQAFEGKI